MTQLPSTTILHRTPEGADTQLSLLEGTRALHPLQKWLGVQNPGAYLQTQHPTPYAFTPLRSMWSAEISDDEDEPLNDNHPGIAPDFPPPPPEPDSDNDNDN